VVFGTVGTIAGVVFAILGIRDMGRNWRKKRDGSWHAHYVILRGRVVQRRLVDGRWQYRAATIAELEQRERDSWTHSG
jgi:hypothetical protein